MKQQLVSLKRLVLVTLLLTMTGISTLAVADEILLGYKDANGVEQTLVIDGNSSDEDLLLAASLIETNNVAVTSNVTRTGAFLDALAASVASKASSPGNATLIGNVIAASNPAEASAIRCAVNAISGRKDPACPSTEIASSYTDKKPPYTDIIGTGGGGEPVPPPSVSPN